MKTFVKPLRSFFAVLSITSLLSLGFASNGWTASAKEIDAGAQAALDKLYNEVSTGKDLVAKAKGVLVFPFVIKAGIGIGGEYGEGVLLINGKPDAYYSTVSASVGLQLGAQKKSIVLLFMEDSALRSFKSSSGWQAGVDASVAVVTLGVGGSMDTSKYKEPILGFIIGQAGLMYNLSLEGAKITKIDR